MTDAGAWDADWPLTTAVAGMLPMETASCWRIPLDDLSDSNLTRLYRLLDDQERGRADGYRLAGDRKRSIAAWGGLRILASAALGIAPHDLSFCTGTTGKPGLAGAPIHFNMSHSGGAVLVALSGHHPLGVDVEEIRPLPDHRAIARDHFHPAEAAELDALPETEAATAFFRCWTRKEAICKAVGLGLGLPLNAFRVSCDRRRDAWLLSMPRGHDRLSWMVADLPVTPGYAGALAIQGQGCAVRCRSLAFPAD